MNSPRFRITGKTAGRAGVALLALALAGPLHALPLAPTAPSVTTGTYTVTPNGCNEDLRVAGCMRQWVEEKIEPNGSFVESTGHYTNKPPGTYSYRTGDLYCGTVQVGCLTRYGPSVTVTVVANAPAIDPLSVQRKYEFRAKVGDLAGDSGQDLLIERVTGGSIGNGVIDALILEQTAGTFVPRVPTQAELATYAPTAGGVQISVEDLDVDGFVDLAISGIASVVPGAKDQIVLSPGQVLTRQPKGVRALDASVRSFTADVLDYVVDNDYFEDTAPLTLYAFPVYYFSCPDALYYSYQPFYYESWYSGCYLYVILNYSIAPDYSQFDDDALAIWDQESRVDNGETSSSAAVQAIATAAEDALGYPIGGWDMQEIFTTDGPDADERRGLEVFLAIFGIANANAQEIDTQVAPEQLPLEDDTIYLRGRYVFGSGVNRLHTSLYYRVANALVGNWLSAFDSDKRTLFDGTLVSSSNDPRDNPALTRFTLGTVEADNLKPAYQYFFYNLVPAHAHYSALPLDEKAPYDAIPELPPCPWCAGRNSNGYINGILQATHGHPVIEERSIYFDLSKLTGWEYPVEPHYFGL